MLEAQVTAGYHRADRFHRFLEVDRNDLMVDFPGYTTDRTDRFVVIEVIISAGGRQEPPPPLRTKRSDCSASAYASPLMTFPLLFLEVEPNHPRFSAASIRRDSSADA